MAAVSEAVAADAPALIALWTACDLTRPHNDPHKDIAFALAGDNSTILTIRDADSLAASAMVGHDGHRGWVYYVSVDPARQGQGLGRAIMAAAEAWLAERGIWKSMLMIRDTNRPVHAFYEALGYAEEPRVVMSKIVIDPYDRT